MQRRRISLLHFLQRLIFQFIIEKNFFSFVSHLEMVQFFIEACRQMPLRAEI